MTDNNKEPKCIHRTLVTPVRCNAFANWCKSKKRKKKSERKNIIRVGEVNIKWTGAAAVSLLFSLLSLYPRILPAGLISDFIAGITVQNIKLYTSGYFRARRDEREALRRGHFVGSRIFIRLTTRAR